MASEVIGHELVKLRNICYLESLGSAVVVLNIILPSQVENFSVYFATIAYRLQVSLPQLFVSFLGLFWKARG